MTPLDPQQLDLLAVECGGDAFVGRLVGRYRSLLPDRVRDVVAHLVERDLEAALDRVLSLKVSSATVGACELESLAHRVQAELTDGAVDAALATAGLLSPAAQRADGALAGYVAV